jgi:hypothetical protein
MLDCETWSWVVRSGRAYRQCVPVNGLDSAKAGTYDELGLKKFCDGARVFGAGFHRLLVLALNGQIDFFTVNFRVFGCFDAKANLFAFDLHNSNFDVVVDCYAFAQLTSQNQH